MNFNSSLIFAHRLVNRLIKNTLLVVIDTHLSLTGSRPSYVNIMSVARPFADVSERLSVKVDVCVQCLPSFDLRPQSKLKRLWVSLQSNHKP